ncbi:MAG: endonuclease/exonuclease/phosphatase family protein [Chitinivibrionales bacterium]|nr:endonuclease/exonuclease/phosphatase family protein [Chitinivibrionales bacterium]MBD3355921.1 endonuclease/exonuclease/phosphatase family protein [Chitinivibrionales bacterium]
MASLKIGSFNLYNLVLPGHTYYGTRVYSENTYRKKIEWIRTQTQKMDAQIIGFQEIFHREALVAALDDTAFAGENVHVLNETGDSPVVGLATTHPLVGEAESITDIPDGILSAIGGLTDEFSRFSRPILRATIELTEDLNLTVFVCHLKSKRAMILEGEDETDFRIRAIGETRSLLRRGVEATGLRALILREISENRNPVIVIGDLNDSTRSVTSNVIAGPMPWKFDPFEEKKRHWDRALYSSFDIISQKSFKTDWATYIYNGHYEALDHIYVSEEFYFRNRDRVGNVDFVQVFNDHLKDDTLCRDRLPVWQSDHAQVVVTLNLT